MILAASCQSDDVTLKGGFDYESALIPKLSFVNKNTVAAFGNSATYFYNIEDTPKVKKRNTVYTGNRKCI